ncbi:MAG: protein kinase, partial [Roseibacillus sp.]|nr:protein kinase [Roseibacillus sp.]
MLKFYRYGIKPKEEITEKIKSLGYEHVVTVEESGETSGRSYEVLEKIEHGDLDKYAGGKPLTKEQLKVVVVELSSAVAHMHEAGIIHRDIKPANILVRNLEPLDLVMTDFGISSVSDVSLHMTSVNRTALYSAPEAINGVVAQGTDWWCVGVIILKLLQGKHPLEGMTEQAITFQLVTKGVKVPEDISGEWQLLLKGLLTRDPDNRWDWSQVEQWLGGKRDIATQYEGDQKEKKKYDYRPYKLRGREIYKPEELAVYLGENWPEGVKQFGRGLICDWVKAQYQDQGMFSDLTDITEDEKLDGDGKLSAGLMVMAKDLPLFWKGEVVSRDWLVGHPEETVAICSSRLLHYHEQHR